MRSSTEKQQQFLALLKPHQRSLERYVLAITRDIESSKDVVAETLMVAFERFETLRSPEAFLSFLFTIATRTHRKMAAASSRTVRFDEHAIEALLDPGLSPETAADIGAVYRALAQLPEKQREAVVLFEIIGLPMKEIQEIQGGTLVGVKVRIFRGRKILGRLLGADVSGNERVGNQPNESVKDEAAIDDHQFLVIGEMP